VRCGERRRGEEGASPSRAAKWRLTNQLVVVRVRADPKPDDSIRCLNSDRSVIEAYTSRVVAPYLLEMKRRMLWVHFHGEKALSACSRIAAGRAL